MEDQHGSHDCIFCKYWCVLRLLLHCIVLRRCNKSSLTIPLNPDLASNTDRYPAFPKNKEYSWHSWHQTPTDCSAYRNGFSGSHKAAHRGASSSPLQVTTYCEERDMWWCHLTTRPSTNTLISWHLKGGCKAGEQLILSPVTCCTSRDSKVPPRRTCRYKEVWVIVR